MIESSQNDKIKYLKRLLSDNRFRKKEGVFVVEGQQENERALQFHYEAVAFYICDELFKGTKPNHNACHLISHQIYEKLAYRGTTEGILGIYKTPNRDLLEYQPKDNANIIIIEGIEKPGNLGAILRSCEAFGIEALIVTDTKVDFYNPNVLRSSVGCLFGMQVFQSDNKTTLEFLKSNGFEIYTTFMSDQAQMIYQIDLKTKAAVIFGTEHSGISEFWHQVGKNVLVPMAGTIDSLNLSNAVAITCYEALRQRLNHKV